MTATIRYPLFSFLRYVSPIWYFNLCSKGNVLYFPDIAVLSAEDLSLIQDDTGFQSHAARRADQGWQAWCKGIMMPDEVSSGEPEELLDRIPLHDEYRFVRKYFHPLWVVYVLMLRLCMLHAPWTELSSFIACLGVRRVNVYHTHKDWLPGVGTMEMAPPQRAPLVSVIIPTLNRYKWLRDVLSDLERQHNPLFEVIIID